jgi:hypothetical protein
MVAALLRGALRWRRLPASKRAVWVGCSYAARVRTPPPDLSDRQGVFCGLLFPAFSRSAFGTDVNAPGLSPGAFFLPSPVPSLLLFESLDLPIALPPEEGQPNTPQGAGFLLPPGWPLVIIHF